MDMKMIKTYFVKFLYMFIENFLAKRNLAFFY